MAEIANTLSVLRQKRGFSAIELAKAVGISRQTVYAIEAGSYVPNTVVAIRLARALDCSVEDLFQLEDEAGPELRAESALLLDGAETPVPGQMVELCEVGGKLMASPPAPQAWYFPASDAVVESTGADGSARVRMFHGSGGVENRILVAGCDPGISVLAKHVQAAGTGLVLAHRNSSQSLELLRRGAVHVAGTHLRDDSTGESNIPEIGQVFQKGAVAVISFAVWEEGIVTALGNPKGIRGIGDFARPDVTVMNREEGAGTRRLLDSGLRKLGIPVAEVRGYGSTAPGHLPAAWHVRAGNADCCIATRAAARVLGLGFVPLVSERYDLAIRREYLDLPGVQALLDTLGKAGFRRELEGLGGYDARAAGSRML
jgi:molybdate-binding protein/DNA-binding XRE family transcriptional regulator